MRSEHGLNAGLGLKHALVAVLLTILLRPHSSEGGSVIDLSGYEVDEFKSELENYDSMFVKFYAPYCGACKAMSKDFEKTAAAVQEDDPPIATAEVDCTSEPGSKICSHFNVAGYPSLQLFKQGDPYKIYEGSRDSEKMLEWLRKHGKLSSTRFSSFTLLDEAIAKADEPVVVGIFTNNQDPLLEQWQKAAKKVNEHWTFRDVEFFHIFDEYSSGSSSNLKSVGLSEGKVLRSPAIVLHRPSWLENEYEPTNIVYRMDSKQDIAEWVFRKAFGVVLYRTRDNEEELKPPLIVAYYDIDFKEHPKRTHYWRNRLVKAAKDNPELRFAISSSQSFRKNLRRQNLEPPKGEDKPLVVGYDTFGTMYIMRDEFTLESFEQFIAEYKAGELTPHLKSQEPPTDNADKAVKVVVGANFHRMVTHNPKDIFISFYAPWCKHSQDFLPTWEELASQLSEEPHLEIAKMDAVANEVPNQFTVPQYPTLYLVPSDTKKPIKYPGGRNIHELIQFLAQHSSQEMKAYTRNGGKRGAKTEL